MLKLGFFFLHHQPRTLTNDRYSNYNWCALLEKGTHHGQAHKEGRQMAPAITTIIIIFIPSPTQHNNKKPCSGQFTEIANKRAHQHTGKSAPHNSQQLTTPADLTFNEDEESSLRLLRLLLLPNIHPSIHSTPVLLVMNSQEQYENIVLNHNPIGTLPTPLQRATAGYYVNLNP